MTPGSPIPVHILLFARYAELLGNTAVTVELPAGSRVSDAVASLRRLPGGAAIPESPFVARNHEQVAPDCPLAPGDELALLPPMSGG